MEDEIAIDEKARRYDYIVRFAREIEGHSGDYAWESKDLQSFIQEHNIQCFSYLANKRQKVSPYCMFQYGKDKVYDLLRHIRNAIAHGRMNVADGNVILQDFSNKDAKTLEMSIPENIFWEFVDRLEKSRKQQNNASSSK